MHTVFHKFYYYAWAYFTQCCRNNVVFPVLVLLWHVTFSYSRKERKEFYACKFMRV